MHKGHSRTATRYYPFKPETLSLVNEFIAEFEGDDPTRWSRLSDAKRSDEEMLRRADEKRANSQRA